MYTEKDLKKLNRDDLVGIATELQLEVKEEDTKAVIMHAILGTQAAEENAEAGEGEEGEDEGGENEDTEEEEGKNEQNGATDEQEAPTPPVDTPKAKAKPAKAKKYVFANAVIHNAVEYAKGQSADDLEEQVFDMLEAKGLVIEFVKPKTPKDIKAAIEKGEEGFKFVRNVEHNGIEYSQGSSADDLEAPLKKLFAEKGFIQLQ